MKSILLQTLENIAVAGTYCTWTPNAQFSQLFSILKMQYEIFIYYILE